MSPSASHDGPSFDEFLSGLAKKKEDTQRVLKEIKFNATKVISNIIKENIDSQGDAADIRIALLLSQLGRQFVLYAGKVSPPKDDNQRKGYALVSERIDASIDAVKRLAKMVPVQTHFILDMEIEDASEEASIRDFALSVLGDVVRRYLERENHEQRARRYSAALMCTVFLAMFIIDEEPNVTSSLMAATFTLGMAAALLSMAADHGHIQSEPARELARQAAGMVAESSLHLSMVVRATQQNGKL